MLEWIKDKFKPSKSEVVDVDVDNNDECVDVEEVLANLTKEELEALQSEGQKNQPAIVVQFTVRQDGNIDLAFRYGSLSKEYSEAFAQLIFMINEGYFIKDFVKLLQEQSSSDISIAYFVKEVLTSWQELKHKKDELSDDPIVQPDKYTQIPDQSDKDE